MRLTFSLCSGVAWTRGALLIVLGGITTGVPGCSFADYTKSTAASEPACGTPGPFDAAASPLASPIAYWTFNYDSGTQVAAEWPDTRQLHSLVPKGDSSDAPPAFAPNRLNGEGNAIALNGHQFAVYKASPGASGDMLFPEELTVSAWLTLPAGGISAGDAGGPVIWPVISTLGSPGNCGGYQLDLRLEDEATGPELVFAFQPEASGDAGGECETHRLSYPIDNSPWLWGTGRWHHVAASLGHSGAEHSVLALHWDGVQLNAGNSAVTSGQLAYANLELYVGTNAQAAGTLVPKLSGTLDEIALFNEALSDSAIREFAYTNISRLGPGNCRWTAGEQWDPVIQTDSGSLATWGPSTSESVSINVRDSDWGAGILTAHVWPPRDLSSFGTVHLNATTPSAYNAFPGASGTVPASFEFTIAHGLDFCTWIMPAGKVGTQDIPLAYPSYCSASSCQFPITSVNSIRVATDWRDNGIKPLELTVSGLELGTEGTSIDPATYGGVIGPRDWCWRPIGYEIGALARLLPSASGKTVAAELSGAGHSSTRIAADFGSRVLDLTTCDAVQITGSIPVVNTRFSFGLQDVHGAWMDWDIGNGKDGIYEIGINVAKSPSSASSENTQNDPAFTKFDKFDKSRVNQIAVQKPWDYGHPVNVEIVDLQFKPLGCQRWSKP